jgi:predicted GNAT family N-acyltransferase
MKKVEVRKIKNNKELYECFKIRTVVFVEEQKVPAVEEIDEFEDESTHYVLIIDNKIVGTARTRIIDNYGKIQRVAILKEYRGKGFGKLLMEKIIKNLSKNKSLKYIKLGAQCYAQKFYEKLGFKAYGDIFDDAGIPHINMKIVIYSK